MGSHLLLLAPPPAEMIRKDPVLEAYQQEITYVFHALRWLGARPQEIEDLAQEVFIALRRAWSRYDSSRPLRPYLFGVAFRVVSMQRRKTKREVAFGRLEIRDGGPYPDEVLQAKQARAMVMRALEKIPLRRRAVLVMHDLEEVPMAQVATTLSIPLFTAYSRLAQGARGAGGRDSAVRQGREQAVRTLPPLSPELEALLAPNRAVLPLAPSVEARAIARAPLGRRGIAWAGRPVACPSGRSGCSRRRPAWCWSSAQPPTPAARGWACLLPRGSCGAERVVARRRLRARGPAVGGARIEAPAAGVRRTRHTGGERSAGPAQPRSARPTRSSSCCGPRGRTSRAVTSPGALAVIAEHGRRFRHGSLVEEREALRVKSLAGLGRHEEAQRAAAEFHARFPHSVFLATFERMKEADR